MEIKYPILLLALLAITQCSQDVPIQTNGYGFTVGDPYGTLQIQFYLDFLCPDAKQSYQAWYNVRRSLSLQQNRVKLNFQFFPLAYHFYSAVVHEAFFYVLKQAGTTAAENYMTYIFGKQQNYAQQNYLNKTSTQFIQEFSQQIGTVFGVNPSDLAKQLVIGSDIFKSLKDHWRFTTITHGVSNSPYFYANGVLIDGAEDYTYLDWINFIKKYKKSETNLKSY